MTVLNNNNNIINHRKIKSTSTNKSKEHIVHWTSKTSMPPENKTTTSDYQTKTMMVQEMSSWN